MTHLLEYGRVPSCSVDAVWLDGSIMTANGAKPAQIGPELIDLVIAGSRFSDELEAAGVIFQRHGLRHDDNGDIVYVFEFEDEHDFITAQFLR